MNWVIRKRRRIQMIQQQQQQQQQRVQKNQETDKEEFERRSLVQVEEKEGIIEKEKTIEKLEDKIIEEKEHGEKIFRRRRRRNQTI